MPEEKPFTVEEVAENLGVKPDTVRAWIRAGELDATNVGGNYRIYPSDLEVFKERRRTGRKREEET